MRLLKCTLVLALALWAFPLFVQQTTGQQRTTGQQTTGQQTPLPPTFRPPIYETPQVRDSIRITADQLRLLQPGYGRIRENYSAEVGRLQSLNERERAARTEELIRNYHNEVGKSTAEILNKAQMERYQQLELQRRGVDVFTDVEVRRQLALTQEQSTKLRNLGESTAQALDKLRQDARDAEEAAKRYDEMMKGRWAEVEKILTDEQIRRWREMRGEPFAFPPPFEIRKR